MKKINDHNGRWYYPAIVLATVIAMVGLERLSASFALALAISGLGALVMLFYLAGSTE